MFDRRYGGETLTVGSAKWKSYATEQLDALHARITVGPGTPALIVSSDCATPSDNPDIDAVLRNPRRRTALRAFLHAYAQARAPEVAIADLPPELCNVRDASHAQARWEWLAPETVRLRDA